MARFTSSPKRPGSSSTPTALSDSSTAFRLGIDENGLGPRLGPLVVTSVAARTTGAGHRRAERPARGKMRDRLGDSKKLVSHGDTSLGEAWARAIGRRMGFGELAHPDALVSALSLDGQAALREPCPEGHQRQCWATEGESFTAEESLVDEIGRDLDRLQAGGIQVLESRCVVTCTRRLNEGIARGLTRFHVDLHCMERLALHGRAVAREDIVATCGKVGGFDRYAPAFGPMGGWMHAVAEEGRARSEYAIAGLGRIAFVRDADDSNLLVSMASLVGKWVRDLLMARVVRYHREHDAELPQASGYHDPVTTRFIAESRLSRSRRALPEDCFERKAWGRQGPGLESGLPPSRT